MANMIIAVLGFGNVESQMAKLRKKAGHDVVIGLRDSSNDTAAAQQIAAVKLWIALAMKGFAGGAFAFNIVRKENA
jgi:predicted dinucleotide-binding enzyme